MVRPARPTDAEDMAVVQNGIYRAGLRESPVDVALVRGRGPGIPTMSLRGGGSSVRTSTLTLVEAD